MARARKTEGRNVLHTFVVVPRHTANLQRHNILRPGPKLGIRPAAGAPTLQCAAAVFLVVETQPRGLRRTTSSRLHRVKLVLNTFVVVPRHTANLQRHNIPRPGPKLGIRAPGNIRQRLNADERHTANADIQQQSREEGLPEKAGRVVEFTWRRQRPRLVEQQGGAHVTVDVGQRHEQLGPLIVADVIQLHELVLQHRVWVISRWNEELRNPLNGTLRQGLDDVIVLGQ